MDRRVPAPQWRRARSCMHIRVSGLLFGLGSNAPLSVKRGVLRCKGETHTGKMRPTSGAAGAQWCMSTDVGCVSTNVGCVSTSVGCVSTSVGCVSTNVGCQEPCWPFSHAAWAPLVPQDVRSHTSVIVRVWQLWLRPGEARACVLHVQCTSSSHLTGVTQARGLP